MPVECEHGRIVDGGDFAGSEDCIECDAGLRLTGTEWKERQQAESLERAKTLRSWREYLHRGTLGYGLREPYASEVADFLTGYCAERFLFGKVIDDDD